MGGTALRKIFGLNRMSEDLDFVVPKTPDSEILGDSIVKYFNSKEFYDIDFKIQEGELIFRLTLKFEILFKLGLSGHKDEKLYVKIEFKEDTHKYPIERTIVNLDGLNMTISHFDLPTLMAGKILACLDRVWKKGGTSVNIKGRDYYDLIWYMEKGIVPNEKKLINENEKYNSSFVWKSLDKKIDSINPEDLKIDLSNYIVEGNVFISDWCELFKERYKKLRKNNK